MAVNYNSPVYNKQFRNNGFVTGSPADGFDNVQSYNTYNKNLLQNSSASSSGAKNVLSNPGLSYSSSISSSNPFTSGPKTLSGKKNSDQLLAAATYNGDYNFMTRETPFSSRNAERAIARDSSVANNQFDSLSDQTDSQFYRNGLGGQGVHQASQQQLSADRAAQIANQASNIRETYNQNDYMTRWGQLTQFWQNKLNLAQIKAAYENMRQQIVASNKARAEQRTANNRALAMGIFGAAFNGLSSLFGGGGGGGSAQA